MRSGGNDFNYYKLTKLASCVQFQRMLMFCLDDWGLGPLPSPPLATPLTVVYTTVKRWCTSEGVRTYIGWQSFPERLWCNEFLFVTLSPVRTWFEVHAVTLVYALVFAAPRPHVSHDVTYDSATSSVYTRMIKFLCRHILATVLFR